MRDLLATVLIVPTLLVFLLAAVSGPEYAARSTLFVVATLGALASLALEAFRNDTPF